MRPSAVIPSRRQSVLNPTGMANYACLFLLLALSSKRNPDGTSIGVPPPSLWRNPDRAPFPLLLGVDEDGGLLQLPDVFFESLELRLHLFLSA